MRAEAVRYIGAPVGAVAVPASSSPGSTIMCEREDCSCDDQEHQQGEERRIYPRLKAAKVAVETIWIAAKTVAMLGEM